MSQRPDLHVVDDPVVPVAELIAEQAGRGGSIVLTGGASVGDAYEHAARLEPDWGQVTLWWGDERCVPPDDERSNYRLAQETLLGSGPFEDGAPGALLVFGTADRAQLDTVLAADPFALEGLIAETDVREWDVVLGPWATGA